MTSIHDDLDQVLSQPVSEPDPALTSSPCAPILRTSRHETILRSPSFLVRETGKQPKTAEIFKSERSARSRHSPSRSPGRFGPRFARASSRQFRMSSSAAWSRALPKDHPGALDSRSDDGDQLAEPRSTWFFLLLLSYSSAITLALGWVLWTGRSLCIAR